VEHPFASAHLLAALIPIKTGALDVNQILEYSNKLYLLSQKIVTILSLLLNYLKGHSPFLLLLDVVTAAIKSIFFISCVFDAFETGQVLCGVSLLFPEGEK